jgi:uncharacterized protein YecE (DUF72 family)
MAHKDNLRIGTSGWSYPTGAGKWNGIFYPPKRRGAKFDELEYYAEHFDTVEVNSSFYRPPTTEMAKSWAARTPRGFEFSLKLYQKFTHPKMFKETALKRLPRAEGARADLAEGAKADLAEGSMLDLLADINRADIDQFKHALDPLASAGKLGALLAQFPPSFKADDRSIDYLRWLLDVFGDYRVAVELRHKTWSDDVASTLKLLNAAKAAWVQIDEPKFRSSIHQNFLPNVTGFYYLRLHGRNAKAWWKHEKAEDRYNYLYSMEELDPFVEVANAVKALVKKMYLYTNNHFAGKSAANAAMLKQRLGLPVDGEYPDEFVERYPETKGIVKTTSEASEKAGVAKAKSRPRAQSLL